MSKFFRRVDSSSSSGSDASSSDGEEEAHNDKKEESARMDLIEQSSSDTGIVVDQSPTQSEHTPRDFLLHALLEERCLNQALSSYSARNFGPDSPEVLAEARANYIRMCAQLSSLNLISAGLEQDHHSATRQHLRNGLDALGRREAAKTSMPSQSRKLLTDVSGSVSDFHQGPYDQLSPAHIYTPSLQRLLGSGQPGDPVLAGAQQLHFPPEPALGFLQEIGFSKLFENRYQRDFEEHGMLGRGGFGAVYHVRHRLDNCEYAVKKIPLSRSRVQKIQLRGQPELDEFLMELRTLARLEHPNIVRYYGGWIEWVDAALPPHTAISDGGVQARDREATSMELERDSMSHSLSRIVRHDDLEEADIVFEHSVSAPSQYLSDAEEESSNSERLQRISTRGTVGTVSDDNVESIERSDDVSASLASALGNPHFLEPTLALHVQMAMHPLTLAEFMELKGPTLGGGESRPGGQTDRVFRLEHCFHLDPSISILLAILDGIEYLHHEGIVHRDIKPANIFIGLSSKGGPAGGSVDRSCCRDCVKEGTAMPMSLHVRIGDFGLVTELAQDPSSPAEMSAIGTELYRPPHAIVGSSPSLDVYALGVIAFELLYRFETRMERHHLISQLKQGSFPENFASRLSKRQAAEMKGCIEAMMSREAVASAIENVKQMLRAVSAQ